MQTKRDNIYKTARKTAGITREKAAELFGISVESLRDYERYDGVEGTCPSNYIVSKMMSIYNASYLAPLHIYNSTKEFQAVNVVPKITVRDLTSAVLSLLRDVKALTDDEDRLVSICCDGIIEEEEWPIFEEILKEMEAVKQSMLEVQFAKQVKREVET